MNDTSAADKKSPGEGPEHVQPLYVLREQDLRPQTHDEMSFLDLWLLLWREKLLILSVTAVFTALSVAYALTATKWYRAEVLLAPVEVNPVQNMSGALGGIASLVGMNLGAGGTNTTESLAILQSRDFIRQFIEDQSLLHVLFADRWDSATGKWTQTDPARQPDIRNAVKYFNDNVMTVQVERETKLVTLQIDWKDPVLAATWANLLAKRLNDRMRERARVEAQENVAYLQGELNKSTLVTMQQSIGHVLEAEMQKLMMAQGHAEFAFRVIDNAQVPKDRSRPKRALIVALATVAGGMLGVFVVLLRNAVRAARREAGAHPGSGRK